MSDIMAAFKFCLLILSIVAVSAQSPNPVVRVPHGTLQGTWKVSTKGRTYASFQGVPYARPPIGKYRFRVSYVHIHTIVYYLY